MTVEIQYGIDDVVNFNYEKTENCGFCGGSGIVNGQDGSSITCPKCQGVGVFSFVPKIETREKGTIVDIKLKWKKNDAIPTVVYVIDRLEGTALGVNQVEVAQANIIDKIVSDN